MFTRFFISRKLKHKRKIELENGKADLSKIKLPKLSRSGTLDYTLLPSLLLSFLLKPEVLYNLFIIILGLCIEQELMNRTYQYTQIGILIFYMFIYSAQRLYFEYLNSKKAKPKNKESTARIVKFMKNQISYLKIAPNGIQVALTIGDLILVKKDEHVLADLLILDMSGDYCQIESDVENKLELITKQKLEKTSFQSHSELKRHLSNYRTLLTGKIVIENISVRDFHEIKGIIKLKKDPKIENFDIKNVLLKNSVVRSNEWLLGIVLFLPKESLFQRSLQRIKKQRTPFFRRLNNRFLLLCLFLVFLLVLVIYFSFLLKFLYEKIDLFSRSSGTQQQNFQQFFGLSSNFIDNFLHPLVFYSPIMSFFYSFIVEILLCREKLLIERKGKTQDGCIQIKNLKILNELTKISQIFLSKNTLIEPKKVHIKAFLLLDKYIQLNEDEINKMRSYFNQKKSTIVNDVCFLEHGNNQENKDIKEDLSSLLLLEDVLKCFLLCHDTKTKYNAKSKAPIHQTMIRLHEHAFAFCKDLGLEFAGNVRITAEKLQCYKIRYFNTFNEFYPLVTVNEETAERKKFSVIIAEKYVKDNNVENHFTLYVWTQELNTVLEISTLDYDQKEKLKENATKLQEKGLQLMYYLKKELTLKEKEDFMHHKHSLISGLSPNPIEINELYSDLERDCEFLVGAGYNCLLKPFVRETIQCFQEAKMQIYLISRDAEDSSLSLGFQSGVLGNTMIKKLIAEDNQTLFVMMKYIFSTLKKEINGELEGSHVFNKKKELGIHKKSMLNFQQRNRFTLITNARTLELIFQNKYLSNHFRFLLLLSSQFLGFEMTPLVEKELILMVKRLYGSCTTDTILVVGNGFGDMVLMQEADVSVEIVEGGKSRILASELTVNSFVLLSNMMFVWSRIGLENVLAKAYFLFYGLCALVFFRFLTSNALEMYTEDTIIPGLCFCLLTKNIAVWFALEVYSSGDTKRVALLKRFPIMYRQKVWKSNLEIKSLFTDVFLAALLIAIFLFCMNSYGNVLMIQNVTQYLAEIYVGFVFFMFLRFFLMNQGQKRSFNSKHDAIFLLVVFSFTVVLLIIDLSLLRTDDIFRKTIIWEYSNETRLDTDHFSNHFFNITAAILLEFIYQKINKFLKRGSTLDDVILDIYRQNNDCKGTEIDKMVNLKYEAWISEENDKKFSKLSQSIFKSTKIDSTIKAILELSDTNKTDLKYDRLKLDFRNEVLHKKFLLFDAKYLNISRRILILSSLFTVIYLFVNYFPIQSIYTMSTLAFFVLTLVSVSVTVFSYFLLFDSNPNVTHKLILVSFSLMVIGFFCRDLDVSLSEPIQDTMRTLHFVFASVYFINFLIRNQVILFSFRFVYEFFVLVYTIDLNVDRNNQINGSSATQINIFVILSLLLLFCSMFVLQTVQNYNFRELKNKIFSSEQNLKFELVKINELLSILVPSFIRNLMYKGKLVISEDQGDVAILFCDICDFDKIVMEEKNRLIQFLDSIFRVFDQFCFNFKVQKIETVGKTYMACAGLKEYEYSNLIDKKNAQNSTKRILELAIEMMKQAKTYHWGPQANDLKLKIGIHYGPVLAGVIGFHKPQFSLIGDTVNTTSRVCSTGESGHIIMSEAAFKQIGMNSYQDTLVFEPRRVEAKGKGSILTYQVEIKEASEEAQNMFFNKIISQTSPKHSFFSSNKMKSENFGFSEVVCSSGEEIHFKDKSSSLFDSSTKLAKSTDEIMMNNEVKQVLLRQFDGQDAINEVDELTSEEKNMTNEEKDLKSEENHGLFNLRKKREIIKKLIAPEQRGRKIEEIKSFNDVFLFSNDQQINKFRKYHSLDLNPNEENKEIDVSFIKNEGMKSKTKEIDFSLPKKEEMKPKTKETEKQQDFKSQIRSLEHIDSMKQSEKTNNNRKDSHSLNISINADVNPPAIPIPGFGALLAEAEDNNPKPLFIPLTQEQSIRPELEMSRIKLQLIEEEDVGLNNDPNIPIGDRLRFLKQLTNSQRQEDDDDQQEEIEEYYEYLEKKPQTTQEENQINQTGNFPKDNNSPKQQSQQEMDYEGLKDAEGKLFFLKPKRFWFTFLKEQAAIAETFRQSLLGRNLHKDRFYIALLTAFCFATELLTLILYNIYQFLAVLILLKIMCLLVVVALSFMENKISRRLYKSLLSLSLIVLSVLKIVSYNNNFEINPVLPRLAIFVMYCVISHLAQFGFIETIISSLFYLFFDGMFVALAPETGEEYLITLAMVSWQLCIKHMTLHMELDLFNKERVLDYEKTRLNQLVKYLLPPHVMEKMEEKNMRTTELIDRFETVTILFADIVNFTAFSNSVGPSQVFSLLREVFTEFDKLALRFHVYKLYTIGDCYVAISLVDKDNRNIIQEANNIVNLGFSMIEVINSVRSKDPAYKNFNMRIGVHNGNIVGGIVGTDIVRYDIYGNDVYIANKMESSGSPGFVNVSEKVKMLIEPVFHEKYSFEAHKEVLISNSNEKLNSFLIHRK